MEVYFNNIGWTYRDTTISLCRAGRRKQSGIIRFVFCLLVMLCLSVNVVYAQPTSRPMGTTPGDPNFDPDAAGAFDSGGECDWSEYKDYIGKIESGHTGPEAYRVTSPRAEDPSWGKYQFTPGTWPRVAKDCPNYSSCRSEREVISSGCWETQECAMNAYTTDAKECLEGLNWCGLLGQQITANHTHQGVTHGSCTVTKAGLLSGAHNAGCSSKGGGVCNLIKTNGKWSGQVKWRVCDAAANGIGVPSECNPTNTTTPPAGPGDSNDPIYLRPEIDWLKPGQFDALLDSLKQVWVATLQMMTSQLTTAMVNQVMGVGMLFDAKHQLEVQREFQRLTAQAHKDYHPSEQMCTVGTFVRHLAETEKYADLTQVAISERMLDRETISGEVLTLQGPLSDHDSRVRHFVETHCNQKDAGEGLENLCQGARDEEHFTNADVDYTATLSAPLTLKVNFLDSELTPAEEDLMALVNNLFYHEPFPEIIPGKTQLKRMSAPLQAMRSITAMRGVARNSVANIIAEKTESEESAQAMPFIRALIKDFGLEPDEIDKMFGENPSYHAQMEILTKTLYQHPDFVVNLYDKPANVKRIRAAMRAIKLMQDRDIHEALVRREMLLSMILEVRIRESQEELMDDIRRSLGAGRGPTTRR